MPSKAKDKNSYAYKVTYVSKSGFKGCARLTSAKIYSSYLKGIGPLKTVTYAFLGAGKNGGRSLYVKVRSTKVKSYKSLILRKGGNKKLTVKKA